jgi:HlyD family secretion protein
MRGTFGKYLLPALAAGMLLFSILQVVKAHQTPPKPPPPVEPPRTPFGKTVAGAGVVEAETENIAVGSALPGVVLKVFVPVDQVGKMVKKGDPLFRVDNRQLEAQLKYYEATLLAAEAQLKKLEMQPRPEEVPPAEAKVAVAKANVDLQRDLAERTRRLIAIQSASEEDYRQRTLAAAVARQQLLQAQAEEKLLKAGAWEPDKAIARAQVALARAQVEQTKTDLERTLVRAPVDGKVLQVNVREGEFVGAPPSQALMVLGGVKNDPGSVTWLEELMSQALMVLGGVKNLHVRVDIDEHDIPRAYRYFKEGVAAYASPRGDPSQRYPLSFVRVQPYVVPKKSLTGDNTERVDTRVLQVIYRVARDEPGLYVGMQVDVFLETGEKKSASR